MDKKDKCDCTIVLVFGIRVYTIKKLEIFPNPTKDFVNIKTLEGKKGKIEIRYIDGELSLEKEVSMNIQFKRQTHIHVHKSTLKTNVYKRLSCKHSKPVLSK